MAAPPGLGKAGIPYGGVAATIPGVIQVEEFDVGGERVGYVDSTPGNIQEVSQRGPLPPKLLLACTFVGLVKNPLQVAFIDYRVVTFAVTTIMFPFRRNIRGNVVYRARGQDPYEHAAVYDAQNVPNDGRRVLCDGRFLATLSRMVSSWSHGRP